MSMGVTAPETAVDIERVQRQLDDTIKAIGEADGMKSLISLATLQALRFVQANIEVDTTRTKGSLNRRGTNAIVGMVSTNVSYAPYVRDAGHSEQFFDYAARVEGPRIKENFGLEVEVRVNKAFQ